MTKKVNLLLVGANPSLQTSLFIKCLKKKKINYTNLTGFRFNSFLKFTNIPFLVLKWIVSLVTTNIVIIYRNGFIGRWNSKFLFLLNLEILLYKLLGKKIIWRFTGWDLRILSSVCGRKSEFEKYNSLNKENFKNFFRNDYLKILNRNINFFWVVDPGLFNTAKYIFKKKKIFYGGRILHIDNIFLKKKFDQRKLIIHAPSNEKTKGTYEVRKIVPKILNKNKKLELKILKNLSRDKILYNLKKTYIAIDQLYLGSYGIFSLEALKLDVPYVLVNLEDFSNIKRLKYKKMGLIHTNPESLKSTIENIFKYKPKIDLISRSKFLNQFKIENQQILIDRIINKV